MSPRKVQIMQVSDWSGGLNYRDDSFQSQDNELADSMNMMVNPSGGVERRPGCVALNVVPMASIPKNIFDFYGNGVNHLIAQVGNDCVYSIDAATTAIAMNPDALTLTGIMRAAPMTQAHNSQAYLVFQRDAEQVGWTWNGTATGVLGDPAASGWNEAFTSPGAMRIPKARFIASHIGYMFVAATKEGATTYSNRLRFSHPGQPFDWRALDFVEIGDDDDVITGLASFEDTLFVFKNRSIWAVTGYDADTFQQQLFVSGNGAISQEAISVSRYGVAFFDEREGVFLIQSKSKPPVHLWNKIYPQIGDKIPKEPIGKTSVCWARNRLFVSVPWELSTSNARTFVYDAQAGEGGSWYVYGYGLGPQVDFRPPSLGFLHFACSADDVFVLQVDKQGAIGDVFGTAPPANFESWFQTSWFDVGKPGVRKRFRRPTLIMDNDYPMQLAVKIYKDFSNASVGKQFTALNLPAEAGMVWDVDDWGEKSWGGAPEGEQDVVRGGGLGRAYAVQFRVEAVTPLTNWAVNAIEIRFIMGRIR